MNRITAKLLVLFSLFLFSCAGKEKKPRESLRGSEELSVYSSNKGGFDVKYPKGWDTSTAHPQALFFARESGGDDDEFLETMTVTASPLRGEPGLEELKEYAGRDLMASFPGSVIYNEVIEKTTAGNDFILMELNIEAKEKEYITMAALYPAGKNLLMLTMMGSKDDFYNYQQLFKTIAKDFSFDK